MGVTRITNAFPNSSKLLRCSPLLRVSGFSFAARAKRAGLHLLQALSSNLLEGLGIRTAIPLVVALLLLGRLMRHKRREELLGNVLGDRFLDLIRDPEVARRSVLEIQGIGHMGRLNFVVWSIVLSRS